MIKRLSMKLQWKMFMTEMSWKAKEPVTSFEDKTVAFLIPKLVQRAQD